MLREIRYHYHGWIIIYGETCMESKKCLFSGLYQPPISRTLDIERIEVGKY